MINDIIEYLKSNTLNLASQVVMILFTDCVSNQDNCTSYHLPKSPLYTIFNVIILIFITILKFCLNFLNAKYNIKLDVEEKINDVHEEMSEVKTEVKKENQDRT
tara:strand:- start:218 stop:529 length:312 start_codon:yes stop_codon:yes gene_type:complete